MSATSAVRVELGPRSYTIDIGAGILPSLGGRVRQCIAATRAVVITDAHVVTPHADVAVRSLAETGLAVERLVVPPGEETKSVAVAADLWRQLQQLEVDRQTVVVAVGGGVIGDLAGFVAATFARGLAFYQVPTTLLAQVDSSVGGKVGINLPHAKNMVGAFWQPCGVLIDTDVLRTLGDREYRSGLAEVVKYGVILDAQFFAWLESQSAALNARDPAALRHVVERCCRLKADVVERDEREETGLRAVLNYGHTFCHAFESVAGYGVLLHGEAVSIGMLCASRLAQRLGRIPAEVTAAQMDEWAADFDSWDIVDGVSDLFVDTDHWRELILEFAAELGSATGLVAPNPVTTNRWQSTPMATSAFATAIARTSLNGWARLPVAWPSIRSAVT